MIELELTRCRDDRRRYELAGIGSVHFEGLFAVRRGGALRWGDRDLEVRPAALFQERYALSDGDRELALIDARSWGKRPVTIRVEDPGGLEPGLLLFAAFVARQLAEDADSTAGGASAAAVTG